MHFTVLLKAAVSVEDEIILSEICVLSLKGKSRQEDTLFCIDCKRS
ncbi:hypothetical protein PU02_0595 [Bartonella ancashensis]|uniref:Uncharacterized protein n=1 Tax=Bartonella ancashensis TaxID=1318743 RepID=A0A0M4LSJ3_9HYPH|nr:hypothetical protein PU02_0595 [Bartonella ancashensis]